MKFWPVIVSVGTPDLSGRQLNQVKSCRVNPAIRQTIGHE